MGPQPTDPVRVAALREIARRELSRRHFHPFVTSTLPGHIDNWHLDALDAALEEWATTPNGRLIINMPPRHGKSERASIRLPAWILGREPDAQILATAHTARLAGKNSRRAQRLMETPTYCHTFPATRLASGRKAEGPVTRTAAEFDVVGRKGSYVAAGVGGSIVGYGATHCIVDDPIKSREQAESPTFRDKVWTWFTDDLMSRLEPGGRVVIIMHRWHEDDLCGRLAARQREGGEKWTTIRLPAIADEIGAPGSWTGDLRQPGEALWPARYPADRLEQRRKALGQYGWLSLYQQEPIPAGGTHIKDIWFEIVERAPEGLSWVRAYDLAVSTKTSADYTVGVSMARSKDGIYYLRDLVRRRVEWPDACKMIIQAAALDPYGRIGVEDYGTQAGFVQELQRLVSGHIKGYKVPGDKLTRALPWIAKTEAGKIKIVRGDWVHDFLAECVSFTGHGDIHDDQVDAVSIAYSMLPSGSNWLGAVVE